ncbi:hypothetical protein [Kiloniella antarctica]|uniref:DUF2249 domain-containing protein n=1 Tax=Kiloniella antarctica TaxID=1550907 RepID=A0ABW5BMY0_9PROT
MSSKTVYRCCDLSVEDLLSKGMVPVDAVIDAIFGDDVYSEVRLKSNFDPIPLRLRLKKMGCKVEREAIKEGWSFLISRNCSNEEKSQALNKKATFKFDGEMVNMDVMDLEFPDNFLEVIRFIDRSSEEERLRVKISAFPQRLRFLLGERNWSGQVEEEHTGFVILLLDKN